MVTPEVTAYFQSISPHATTELKLHERTLTTLKGLQLDSESSRRSTAASLKAIQTELARLAAAVTLVRVPATLVLARATHVKSIQQAEAAAGELGDGLTGDPSTRRKRIESAREHARGCAESIRTSTNSISAALGVAAAALASIPIVGPIIGAILLVVAAIVALIGALLAKAKEQEAAEKEKRPSAEPKPTRRPWPP